MCLVYKGQGHDPEMCSQRRFKTNPDPRNRKANEGNRIFSVADQKSRNGMHRTSEDCMTLQLRIAGQELTALLDSGAKPSVIDLGTVKR